MKSPKNKVAHYLESMVAKKAEDAHRDRQVEKGEYGIHQIQKLVDWASSIGTFKSTH